jgi:hypothetical protein
MNTLAKLLLEQLPMKFMAPLPAHGRTEIAFPSHYLPTPVKWPCKKLTKNNYKDNV